MFDLACEKRLIRSGFLNFAFQKLHTIIRRFDSREKFVTFGILGYLLAEFFKILLGFQFELETAVSCSGFVGLRVSSVDLSFDDKKSWVSGLEF